MDLSPAPLRRWGTIKPLVPEKKEEQTDQSEESYSSDSQQGEDWQIAMRKLKKEMRTEVKMRVDMRGQSLTKRVIKLEEYGISSTAKLLIDIKKMQGDYDALKAEMNSLKISLA
jgi:hypothetical protein